MYKYNIVELRCINNSSFPNVIEIGEICRGFFVFEVVCLFLKGRVHYFGIENFDVLEYIDAELKDKTKDKTKYLLNTTRAELKDALVKHKEIKAKDK